MVPKQDGVALPFIHREISWIMFNERVLEEAADTANPLLERLRFLAIFVSNLDEFYMVRVANILRLLESGFNKKDDFGWYPYDLLVEVKGRIQVLVKRLYEIYAKTRKEMEKKGILVRSGEDLTAEQRRFVKQYFESTLFPIITPMAVDQSHPFPVLRSKTLAFAVSLSRYDTLQLAIIPMPKNISRTIKLPAEADELAFIRIEDVIRPHLGAFFKGYKVADSALFRLVRDSEIYVDEGYAPDLLKAIETEVKKRPLARSVCLEIERSCTPELLAQLGEGIHFPQEDVTFVTGELDLTYLFDLIAQIPRQDLCYQSFVPAKITYDTIFERIKESDLLVHHPYQSFAPVIDLLQSAAVDPDVLAIKMTLYRTNAGSAVIGALKEAAKNGKQVTVLVEIKARFDEERNIEWARELEMGGCHVVYGIAGMKIHSKMTLVVRREEQRIRRYVHLSTGNYNENTARVYTDIGYLTANEDFARDISEIFNVITGYSMPSRWKRIVSAPYDLRDYFFELIDQEIEYQKKYKNGRIVAKINSLEDPQTIVKLYEAARAGVSITLIVRGICCLVPGVKGVSETIEVRSVVGRFLEHSRIYQFHNNGSDRFFLSSADWMRRNLDRRIELLFEVGREDLKEQLRMMLATYLADTAKTRLLTSDMLYVRPSAGAKNENAQENLIKMYAAA